MAITVKTQVTQMYVALFGRAPDAGGLTYWEASVNGGKTLAKVAQEMYDTTDARVYYPSAATDTAVVTSFYTNVLGRAPDAAGLTYWLAELGKVGATKGSVISDMLYAVTNYTGTDPLGLTSQKLFNNKVVVGQYYAETMGGGVTGASNAISTVTATSDVSSNAAIAAIIAGASVTGQSFTLTTVVETKTLTAGNDTVTGTVLDSIASDNIIDASGADSDTLNIWVTGNVNPATVANVEIVNVTGKYGSVTADATKYVGVKTFTADSTVAGGSVSITSASATSMAAIKASTNVSTLSVSSSTEGTGTGVAVDAGAATTVTLTGTGSKTDIFGLTLNGGNTALTTTTLTESADKLTITGAGSANTVTITTGAKTVIAAGSQNMTLKGTDGVFSGNTITKSLDSGKTLDVVITGAATTADFSKVGADAITLQGTGNSGSYTIAEGGKVKIDTTANLTLTAATSATTVNVDLLKATTGTLTNSTFTIANITANTAEVTSTDLQFGTSADLKLYGNQKVTVAGTSTYKSLDASNLTAKLTITDLSSAGQLKTTGGSGDDSLKFSTTAWFADTSVSGGLGNDTITIPASATTTANYKLTLDGGDGTGDTLVFATDTIFCDGTATTSNVKTSVITGFEIVDVGTTTVTITQKQIFTDGNTFTLKGTGALVITDDALSSDVYDISGLQFVAGVAAPSITINGDTANANVIKAANAATIVVGGSANDNITGGAGNDKITGAAGADLINVGAGVDTVILTTGTAGSSDSGAFALASGTTNTISTANFDVLTGMAATDIIQFSTYTASSTTAANLTLDSDVVLGNTVATTGGITLADNSVHLIRGTYDATASTFVGSASGSDTLFVYDAATTTGAYDYDAVVLVGYVGTTFTSANTAGIAPLNVTLGA